MADASTNSELNRVLIRLYRSKLQYVGEAWPWTSAEEVAAEAEVMRLVETQQQHVGSLVELLTARGWPIYFGQFPDLSELHYVTLDYVLAAVVEDAEDAVEEIEAAKDRCTDDRDVWTLLTAILDAERASLAKLKGLTAERKNLAAA